MPKHKEKENISQVVTEIWKKIKESEPIEQATKWWARIVCEENLLNGWDQEIIASTCLYIIAAMTCKPLSFEMISAQVNIHVQIIKECYKKLYPRRVDIVPQWFSAKIKPENLPKIE